MFRAIPLIAAILISSHAFAQEKEQAKFLRLDFVIRETDGSKVMNSRSYFAQISTAHDAKNVSIRTGSKVPVVSGNDGSYSYTEVGADIDCARAKVEEGQLSIYVAADVSSILQETSHEGSAGKFMKPTIRQNRWAGDVVVPLRKATIIFSSDDLTTKRQLQLELTATQIK